MEWWLTVFFLMQGAWISGDSFEGWASRAYPNHAACEARRSFADLETSRHPLDLPARWVCNRGTPATKPPPEMLNVKLEAFTPPGVHWYEPPNPLGLEVFTREQLPWIAADAVGFRYTGPLQAPFARQLREHLLSSPQKYNHVLLELDSDGGSLDEVKEIVSVLREAGSRMELTTRVMEGSLCASGCIPVFLQGRNRKASGSSIWVFHGASSAFSNIPDPQATEEYLDLMAAGGMSQSFRELLETDNRIYRPGSFIFSGYEIFAVHNAGIITELLPSWREQQPVFPAAITPR